MIFFVADTHFSHKNIIRYAKRPFKTVQEMNSIMIKRWNDIVRPQDIIYHLGDFGFGKNNVVGVLEQLNGKKFLCRGSHDKDAIKAGKYFQDIKESFYLSLNGHQLFLSHYLHYVWPKSHYGSWHLYGHSHGGLNDIAEKHGKCLDIGVDSHYFTPWSLYEIIDIMKARPENFNQVRNS